MNPYETALLSVSRLPSFVHWGPADASPAESLRDLLRLQSETLVEAARGGFARLGRFASGIQALMWLSIVLGILLIVLGAAGLVASAAWLGAIVTFANGIIGAFLIRGANTTRAWLRDQMTELRHVHSVWLILELAKELDDVKLRSVLESKVLADLSAAGAAKGG